MHDSESFNVTTDLLTCSLRNGIKEASFENIDHSWKPLQPRFSARSRSREVEEGAFTGALGCGAPSSSSFVSVIVLPSLISSYHFRSQLFLLDSWLLWQKVPWATHQLHLNQKQGSNPLQVDLIFTTFPCPAGLLSSSLHQVFTLVWCRHKSRFPPIFAGEWKMAKATTAQTSRKLHPTLKALALKILLMKIGRALLLQPLTSLIYCFSAENYPKMFFRQELVKAYY